MEDEKAQSRIATLRVESATDREINLVTALAFAVIALRAFEKHAFTPSMQSMAKKYADAADAALDGHDPLPLLAEPGEPAGDWNFGTAKAKIDYPGSTTVTTPISDAKPIHPDHADLAFNFKLGCVAPDGTIWIGKTERLKTGRVQLTEVEAEKAKRFGWTEYGSRVGKHVYMERRS